MHNKVVVVTGGAQNIGNAIAQVFASAGATTIIGDINAPSVEKNVKENHVSHIDFHPLNVCDEKSVDAFFRWLEEKYGCIGVLVNNAGIAIEEKFSDTSLDDWNRVMDVNVTGVFLCAKATINQIKKHNQKGVIINIGSIEGLAANPMHGVYGTSKGSVHAMTRNIAIDHGCDGIRCNAIAPGWINTPFNDSFIHNFPNPENALKEILALHPMGQLGTPSNVGQLALWLASDASEFINGQVISIDGARTAKLPLPAL